MSCNIKTYGCRLNFYESEVIRKFAKENNIQNTTFINSCAVTNKALSNLKGEIRKTKRENPKEKIILTIARLTHQKNIEILIKSFSKSIAFKKKWKLIIIGDGEEKKKLYELSKKLNVFKSIIFMKKIRKIDIWYKKASIFILPSKYEGMPNVIIEAMQSKTAIIGSNILGIKYFIKNKLNGIIFKNNDENSLIKKINLLVNNSKLRDKLAQNGKNSINKYIRYNNFLGIWENQLNKIIENEN